MSTWLLIAVLAIGTIALKSTGPLLAGGKSPPSAITRVIALLTPAIISALVISDTFTNGNSLLLDARAAGVAAGAIALLLKSPAPIALILAGLTAATLRALG